MDLIYQNQAPWVQLAGRRVQRLVGRDAALASDRMTVGIAYYSVESGPMEPHQHAEETVYVLDAREAWVRFGPAPDSLTSRVELAAGMTLRFPEMEWHVFEWANEGYLEGLVAYGQVDNIRPEDTRQPEVSH